VKTFSCGVSVLDSKTLPLCSFNLSPLLYVYIYIYTTQPTLQSVGDEFVGLFAFCRSSAGAAVGLRVGASAVAPDSSVRVQRGVGGRQKAGRVWIGGARVVRGAVPPEAVCVRRARGPLPGPLLSRLGRRLVPRTRRAGAAAGRRQQLPLCRDWTETLFKKNKKRLRDLK